MGDILHPKPFNGVMLSLKLVLGFGVLLVSDLWIWYAQSILETVSTYGVQETEDLN